MQLAKSLGFGIFAKMVIIISAGNRHIGEILHISSISLAMTAVRSLESEPAMEETESFDCIIIQSRSSSSGLLSGEVEADESVCEMEGRLAMVLDWRSAMMLTVGCLLQRLVGVEVDRNKTSQDMQEVTSW